MRLKPVRTRRGDALAGESWDEVERLLADYYRRKGYDVEHCGTGGRASRFDGGVDLRLRRGAETIIVQCKHWNAYQVPHNDVHQLLGIMVNEGATGAILVTSGEFTRAAIEAATRHGHVQLVDGDDLRAMLGPRFSEPAAAAGLRARRDHAWGGASTSFGAWAAERLVSTAEDRIRSGGRGRGRSFIAASAWSGLAAILIKFILAIALLLFMNAALQRAIRNVVPVQPQAASCRMASLQRPAAPVQAGAPPAQSAVVHVPTAQEVEEQRRRSAESMEILRASTPELPDDPRRRSVLD